MKLGYYLQVPFAHTPTGPQVPFDVAAWSHQFMKMCDRFVCFMNSGDANVTKQPLADGAELVDLGPLRPHWQRMFGMGLPTEVLSKYGKELDAVILQGHTSLLPHVARAIRPALPVFLLIGFWTPPQPGQFKTYGRLRELGVRAMMAVSEQHHRKIFPSGIILGNNPLMGKIYGHLAPFQLISKALVPDGRAIGRASQTLHDPVRLLYFGRVDPDKHIETLVEAARILKGKLNFIMEIIGGGYDAYCEHLRRKISSLDLNDCVKMYDSIAFEKRFVAYHDADLFLFNTCGTEGFPRVIWDAFAMGVPVIAAEYPGAGDFFTDKQNILLFPRCDASRLADLIMTAVADEPLRVRLAQKGLELLRDNTLEVSCRKIFNIIESAVAMRREAGRQDISLDLDFHTPHDHA